MVESKLKRRRLTKEDQDERIPVRPCTSACAQRDICYYFISKKVTTDEPCLPDQLKIKEISKAFEDDDLERIKREAGRMVGATYQMALNMLDQIIREGLTKKAPMTDRDGFAIEVPDQSGLIDYIYIEKAHPLIDPFMKAVRLLNMDPKEFGLTPMSQAKKQTKVNGRINIENIDMKVIRLEGQERMDAFADALGQSKEMREADRVFQQFKKGEDGDDPDLDRLTNRMEQLDSGS